MKSLMAWAGVLLMGAGWLLLLNFSGTSDPTGLLPRQILNFQKANIAMALIVTGGFLLVAGTIRDLFAANAAQLPSTARTSKPATDNPTLVSQPKPDLESVRRGLEQLRDRTH